MFDLGCGHMKWVGLILPSNLSSGVHNIRTNESRIYTYLWSNLLESIKISVCTFIVYWNT